MVRHKKIERDSSGTYQWEVFYHMINGSKIAHVTTPTEIVVGLKIMSAMGRAQRSQKTEMV